MKKLLWLIVCLMTIVVSANAHNAHYPTYTEDGITYVKTGGRVSISGLGVFDTWEVSKVDKPYDKTIVIPYIMTINGEEVRIKTIKENAFLPCISLDSLIISDGVMIDDGTFKGCKQLDYLCYSFNGYRSKDYNHDGIFCKTLETFGVGEDAFWKAISNSLEKLIVKNTENFYNRVDYCKNLKTIICFADNPPYTIAAKSSSSYSGSGCYVSFEPYQWSTITLYVPKESLEKYYFDNVWGEIDNIYAIDEMNNDVSTSISSIPNNTNEKGVWYSLNGTKIDKPTKGVYIKNGKKYIVK